MKPIHWKTSMLAVSAAVALTACSGGTANEAGTGEATTSEQPSGAKQAEAVQAPLLNPAGMPIVNEPISLTFFTGKSATNGSKFEETLVWKEYAKMTNMNITFELVPFESLTEKRNLVLAGGDYPDVFYSSRLTAAEVAKYGGQGILVPLNDMIDEYAPNIKKLMEQYPNLKKGLTMPDGNIYSLPSFYDPEFLSLLVGKPLWVNEDWLKQLGMSEPTTVEEFYNYLKAVKENDVNGNGKQDEIPYGGTGIGELMDQLKGAWGLGTRGLGHKFVDIDPATNELRFIKTESKYKELLQYVNRLYTEGLIDKEIFTIKGAALNVKGQDGLLGATIVPNPATVMGREEYIGLSALEGPHGDRLYSHLKVPMVHVGAFAITDKNPHPEATLRWMDYFYGDEGAKFYFMGQEGVTYETTAEGELKYVEEITNNPQGLTQDQALAKYFTWLGGSYPGVVKSAYFKGSESLPEAIAAGEKARPYIVKEIWNYFNFTQAETEIMSSIGKDIQTYTEEMEAKFVNGSASFAEWDKYVETIGKMGLDEYMKVYQAAYERYNQ
ncbi:extracellular solute-binding protein [Paenibacillus sp. TRM 82003]|nr:extracellular solute-binding protein [Paenibacillus sp. TRM 82003]